MLIITTHLTAFNFSFSNSNFCLQFCGYFRISKLFPVVLSKFYALSNSILNSVQKNYGGYFLAFFEVPFPYVTSGDTYLWLVFYIFFHGVSKRFFSLCTNDQASRKASIQSSCSRKFLLPPCIHSVGSRIGPN